MRRRLLAGVVAGLAIAVTIASPAAGEQSGDLSGTVEAPVRDAPPFTAPAVPVKASFSYSSDIFGATGTVREIKVEIVPGAGQPLPDGATTVRTGSGQSLSLEWTTPALLANGPYVAKVVATGRDRNGSPRPLAVERAFSLRVAPVAPSGVAATADDGGRAVTLSWKDNPEPDVLAYGIRRAGSDASFGEVVVIDDTAGTASYSYRDEPGPGTWRYSVVALRAGASAQDEPVPSEDSKAASATVTPPPTTTAAPAPGAGGSTAGGGAPGTTAAPKAGTSKPAAAPASPGRVDLSSFSALLEARRRAATPTRPVEPDPGYQETLPFAAGDEPVVDAPADGGQAAADSGLAEPVLRRVVDDSRQRALIVGIAGFLVCFVGVMQVRWILGRVREADALDALDPTPLPEPDPDADISDLADSSPAEAMATFVPTAPAFFAPVDAPALDVPMSPRARRRARRAGSTGGAETTEGSTDAGRAAPSVPPRAADDRREGGAAVRARRRGSRSGDGSVPVG